MIEVERLAIVETKIDHVITLLEGHIGAGCSGTDCKLNDRVVVCETNLKTYKRGMWTALAACLALIMKGVFTAWLK